MQEGTQLEAMSKYWDKVGSIERANRSKGTKLGHDSMICNYTSMFVYTLDY